MPLTDRDPIDARMESDDDKIARYERFLRAFAEGHIEEMVSGELGSGDLLDWAKKAAAGLLAGDEAECPNCCTPLHEGACVEEHEFSDLRDEGGQ